MGARDFHPGALCLRKRPRLSGRAKFGFSREFVNKCLGPAEANTAFLTIARLWEHDEKPPAVSGRGFV